MRVAIMQPYLFPYLGYLQLASAVDRFVFYDDVAFIKGGWINRNRILVNGAPHWLTVPLHGLSPHTAIAETAVAADRRWLAKASATLAMAYAKAPYAGPVTDLVLGVLDRAQGGSIADAAIDSVVSVLDYLDLPLAHERSSTAFAETRGTGRTERVVEIARRCGATRYVNAIGGTDLYEPADFSAAGIELTFLESAPPAYPQHGTTAFVPALSIIDVLMNNSVEQVRAQLGSYRMVRPA